MPDVGTPVLFGRLRWVAVALVGLLCGCGLMAGEGGPAPVNSCEEDSDCGAAGACDRGLRVCVAREPPTAGVFLRFTHPTSSGVGIREVRSQRLEALTGETLSFDFDRPIDVQGWVAGGSPLETVRARLTFSRPSGIAGDPPETVEVTSSDDPATYADWTRALAYSVSLPPYREGHEPYMVYIEPMGEDAALFPPVLRENLQFQARTSSTGEPMPDRFEETLPAVETLRTLTGLITRSDGAPIPNLSVRAEDPDTGRRISTITTTAPYSTTTDGDDPPSPTGTFTLHLPDSVSEFRLVVAPTPDEPTFPTMSWEDLDFVVLDLDRDGTVAFDGTEQPAIAFPAIGLPVRLEGSVEGTETGTSSAVPVAGATLRFFRAIDTSVTGVTASFEQIAMTDNAGRIVPPGDNPDGAIGIALLEGDYAVTVTPPASLRMAGLHMEFLRIAPPSPTGERVQRGQVFQLEPRAELHGTVLDLGGGPAGALLLEAHLLQATGQSAGADPSYLNRVISGSTDFFGDFDLYVEPGSHLVVLRPPDSTFFPWRVVPEVVVPDGRTNVSLEAPVLLSGVVTLDAEPTAGILVEALLRHEAFGGATVEVGRAETDATGSFRLLLSPSLGEL